jgi:hypothetical protein
MPLQPLFGVSQLGLMKSLMAREWQAKQLLKLV